MGEPLNLFFKPHSHYRHYLWLLLLAALVPCMQVAQGISINAIYTAACRRDVGLIMQVDDHDIQFLSLDGTMKRVPKHEIIYLAYYPSDVLPMGEFKNPESIDYYRISTSTRQGKVTELVSGWPIGFTEDKIAFLGSNGSESVVSRRSLFSLSRQKVGSKTSFDHPQSFKRYQFVHPYQFRDCAKDRFMEGKTQMFPQQILSQPVMIKRELDYFQKETTRLRRYYREQDFYAVPEIYENSTSLGLWHTFGYRHGGSSKRVSNFTPVLTDSYSSDIFDYQHLFVAGSAPIATSLQEEPQVHSLYSFKASYFHFMALFDPNVILVGRNYEWQFNDFDSPDDRWNSTTQIESGFDFGNWSLLVFLADAYQIGIYNGVELNNQVYALSRFGLKYRNTRFGFDITSGTGSPPTEDFGSEHFTSRLGGTRLNLSAYQLWHMDWMLSLIDRNIDYQSKEFFYIGRDRTLALYGTYPLSIRYRVGGFVSAENHSNEFTQANQWKSDSATYFKVGTHFSLTF